MGTLRHIPIDDIEEPMVYLRSVFPDSLEFIQLRDSIRGYGVLNSILVRPSPANSEKYQLVDGAWRLSAAKAAGLKEIPAICEEIPDELVTTFQLITNAPNKITQPIEFARHIERIRRAHKGDISMSELACMIKRSPKWIMEILDLLKLSPDIKLMVNRGEIPLGSAKWLAKMPFNLRKQLIQEARIKTVKDFSTLCSRLLKAYKEEVKNGRMEDILQSKEELLRGRAVSYQRSMSDVQDEINEKAIGGVVIHLEGCESAMDGFYAGLKWTLHTDANSVSARVKFLKERVRVADQPLKKFSTKIEK